MKDMEEFKEEVKKLNQLVISDEQGMMCWWGFLDERMTNLFKMYYGVEPDLMKARQLRNSIL
ncbi:MAG: hypothetical protein J7L15_08335 [Clostridiales bacterium]|nr:hypothetical protein [Clostridiales bacterium]